MGVELVVTVGMFLQLPSLKYLCLQCSPPSLLLPLQIKQQELLQQQMIQSTIGMNLNNPEFMKNLLAMLKEQMGETKSSVSKYYSSMADPGGSFELLFYGSHLYPIEIILYTVDRPMA